MRSIGDARRARARRELVLALAGIAVAAAACGGSTATSPALDATVAAGQQAYQTYACGQCHGARGEGRMLDLPDGQKVTVPRLDGAGSLSQQALVDLITNGYGNNPGLPPGSIFMPAWSGVIPSEQIRALAAYLKAGLPPPAHPRSLPSPGSENFGAALFSAYACDACHGAGGAGGVPNPRSDDKTIPALRGADFRMQFDTADKIVAVIREGSILGPGPEISMPAWKGLIPSDQMQALAAYIQALPVQP